MSFGSNLEVRHVPKVSIFQMKFLALKRHKISKIRSLYIKNFLSWYSKSGLIFIIFQVFLAEMDTLNFIEDVKSQNWD